MARKSRFGKHLITSMKQAVEAVEAGTMDKLTVRRVVLPAPPSTYDAAAVRAVRNRLGVSQAVFARILGVSTVLAQAWEQSVRKPSPMACRLLEEIDANPDRWRRKLLHVA